ncbi:hypothetical protein OS493_026015 [Desmophyllum pertusum]|uniref:Uncharacterized protein n=1 Tax=Desmophyllum pertusum TaxID=174260 RepID=A0A9W9YLD5_9CNID|nr:hypothetical protein OS493_026015 [Desmophyllum pertusum]
MKNELKALEKKNDTLQKLSEKEHSEIEGELQLWVEDGDKRNKTLEEVIEKNNEENVKLLVQISVMKNELKALEEKNDTLQKLSEKNILRSKRSFNCGLRMEIRRTKLWRNVMKNELKALEKKNDTLQKLSEKEHSEIEEELQLWVEDGDKRNKTLEEVVEKTNEENVKLLVQISVMKNGLKTLEKKNDTLQTELKTKRIDLKRLIAKEHYNERELRNLKRDLKRKDQNWKKRKRVWTTL